MLFITGESTVSKGRHCECSDGYWKWNDFKIYYHQQIFQQVELKILNLKANKKVNSEKKLPCKVSKIVHATVASSRFPRSLSTCIVWERCMYKAPCKDPRSFQLRVLAISAQCVLSAGSSTTSWGELPAKQIQVMKAWASLKSDGTEQGKRLSGGAEWPEM